MKQWMRIMNVMAVAGLMMVAGRAAQADIQIDVDSPTVIGLGGGLFEWNYDVYVATNEFIKTGNYFTIYDFGGFQTGTQNVVGGWAPTFSLSGGDVVGAAPFNDDPNVHNLTWSYTGSKIAPGSFLGTFKATSNEDTEQIGEYAGQGSVYSPTHPIRHGRPDPNLGETLVPAHAPEPCTMALLGFGGAGMLAKLRRRRRQEA